jgi:serine/threonine protein kinase
MSDLIGHQIEQFLISSELGRGKTGVVYRAKDMNLRRHVAIKVVDEELAVHPPVQQRVMQAARMVSHLSHPSIVTLYNFDNQNGRFFIVSDYVEGMSLADALLRLEYQGEYMPLAEVLHIGVQTAEALDVAHQEGVLHLNLKPSNILVKFSDRDGRSGEPPIRALLADFGMSLIPESGIQTALIDLADNLPYLAPEQCSRSKQDGRTDIYSLGIILYEMLSGHPPFDITTATEAIMRHSVEPPLPLRDLRPEIPAYIADIVHIAITKDPTLRYQQAVNLADALRHALLRLTRATDSEAGQIPPTIRFATTGATAQSGVTDMLKAKPSTSGLLRPSTDPLTGTPTGATAVPTPPPASSQPLPELPTPPQPISTHTVPEADQLTPPPIITSKPAVQPMPAALENWDLVPIITPPPPSAAPVALANEPIDQIGTAPLPKQPLLAVDEGDPVVHEMMTQVVFDEGVSPVQLVILRHGRSPKRVVVEKNLLQIGRSQDNDVVLNAPDVSRHHARLERRDTGWVLTDLSSSAGTFGAGHRLDPYTPFPWQPQDVLQIGPYFLHWEMPELLAEPSNEVVIVEESKTEMFQVPDSAGQTHSTQGRFNVAMYPALLTLTPGEQHTIQVELFNQGNETDTLKLAVSGLPAGTFSLSQHFVTLAPGARTTIPLAVQLPANGTVMAYRITAGNYPFELLVHSKKHAADTAVVPGLLLITTQELFSVGLWPTQVDDGRNITILIRNEGNVPNSYSLLGRDDSGNIRFRGQRGRLTLKPGETITQTVTVRFRERPYIGRAQEVPFEVSVSTENGVQDTKTATLKVKPVVPEWALVAVGVMLMLLLVVFLASSTINGRQFQTQTPVPTQTPTSIPISDAGS